MARWRSEPFALFIGKNVVFAALIVGATYLLSSYKGLPNVLITMGVLICSTRSSRRA